MRIYCVVVMLDEMMDEVLMGEVMMGEVVAEGNLPVYQSTRWWWWRG